MTEPMSDADLRRIKRHLKDAIRAYDGAYQRWKSLPDELKSDVGYRHEDELLDAIKDADALITLINEKLG